MTLRRVLPFIVIIFALTGCFRQSADTFDAVDSSSSEVILPTDDGNAQITIIAPDADNTTAPEIEPTVDESTQVEEPTITIIQPTNTVPPTVTNIPPPTEDTSAEVVPTATEATFITPQTNVEVALPTATPASTETPDSENPDASTDGDDTESMTESNTATSDECSYVVQPGDNAFRIALNYGVSLDSLLEVNDLPANPIIQPGDVFIIPGCDDGTGEVVEVEVTEEAEVTEESTPELEDGFQLHIVVAGETLLSIANQYGITVNDIIKANDIPNPNRISPGQEILIPPAGE